MSTAGSPLQPALYSEAGKALALKARQEADRAGTWDEARKAIQDAFEKMDASGETTALEKALARFAVAACRSRGGAEDMAKVGVTAAAAVQGAMPGPAGAVLAKVAAEAMNKTGSWESARTVLRLGYQALAAGDLASERERDLARLGMAMDQAVGGSEDAGKAGGIVLGALGRGGPASPLGPVIAQVAADALDRSGTWDSARSVMRAALKTLGGHGGTTEAEKRLAAFGLSVDSALGSAEESGKAGRIVAGAIRNAGSERSAVLVAKAAKAAADGSGTWDSAQRILRGGFEAVAADPSRTPAEESLARLGVRLGAALRGAEDAGKVGGLVMQKIVSGGTDLIPVQLADVAMQASDKANTWDSANIALGEALKAIMESPETGGKARALAAKGLAMKSGGPEAVGRERYALMKEIRRDAADFARDKHELEAMIQAAGGEPASGSVEEEQGAVVINGVRLKRKAPSSPDAR